MDEINPRQPNRYSTDRHETRRAQLSLAGCSLIRDSAVAGPGNRRGHRWALPIAFAFCALASACTESPSPAASSLAPDPPQSTANQLPQQAGQPIDTLDMAAHLVAVRGAALIGNEQAVQAHLEASAEGMRRAMKLADPSRPIDRELARVAAKGIPGVRSAVWVDHENLLGIVASNEARSYATIDAICIALEPFGDTLGVVVNLQSGAARTGDDLEILSRNCQLAPGDRAFLQRVRQIDAIAPEIRAQHKANQALQVQGDTAEAQRRQQESLRILEQTTPEM
jgi:hypothetical protein